MLTPDQEARQAAFRAFVDREIAPHAAEHDRAERLHPGVMQVLGRAGYLGGTLPADWGGRGLDWKTFGLLCEALGAACLSVASLLAVHTMTSQSILRWGAADQKRRWLHELASGEQIAAFALSEPGVGSDAAGVRTAAVRHVDGFELTGVKTWISGGQLATLFLVIARCDDAPTAFLVERAAGGVSVEPIDGMLGFRAASLAQVSFDRCRIPARHLIGRIGTGVSHVASYALGLGRFMIAWNCVGLVRSCLEKCVEYTAERMQFGTALRNHQLIREMVADMVANHQAAKLLCLRAGHLIDSGDPDAFVETNIAKYVASRAATHAARCAVQMHGANGCSARLDLARHLRDSVVLEIIEGSSQILQLNIADYAYQQAARPAAAAQC